MEEIKRLLQKNLEYSKQNHEMLIRVKRYMLIQQILSILKLVLILVPIIIAIFYAVPFLREAAGTYRQLIGDLEQVKDVGSGYENLFKEFLQ
jgi:hypothetical protein